MRPDAPQHQFGNVVPRDGRSLIAAVTGKAVMIPAVVLVKRKNMIFIDIVGDGKKSAPFSAAQPMQEPSPT